MRRGSTMARRWMKEWHFRVGVHHLRGLIDGFEAGKQYADLAEAVVAVIWDEVTADFAAQTRGNARTGCGGPWHGVAWVRRRLNAGSDLDLIVIYDDQGVEASDGPRPLATRPYYARLTQAPCHRADGADAGGAALRGRHAAAPLWAAGAGRDQPCKFHAPTRRPRPGPGSIWR